MDPTHKNNVFTNFMLNTVSQDKMPPKTISQTNPWLKDEQIQQKQLVYDEFSTDETMDNNQQKCPTNIQMMRYAVL